MDSIDNNINILLVIPLYNNRNTIEDVAGDALKSGLELLVVDDGSNDGGSELIESMGLSLLKHSENRGKGKAIQTAAAWAEEKGFSHIITIDADGQHDPAELNKFIKKIEENPLSIVVGNRDLRRAGAPYPSRLGKTLSNFWLKVVTGKSLPDTQSGFRAYPVRALNEIKCFSSRYDYEIEILVRSSWAGFDLDFINISVKYSDEINKTSHFRPWLDNLRCIKIFACLLFKRLALR
jgi:glycosyltransferase involved in cell wall biosynthesis